MIFNMKIQTLYNHNFLQCIELKTNHEIKNLVFETKISNNCYGHSVIPNDQPAYRCIKCLFP